jgi:hypothetical protein
MRVIVCGGRDFRDRRLMFDTLDHLHSKMKIDAVIQGGAAGADHLAWLWTIARDIQCIAYPADWSRGRRAGPARTQQMLERSKPDVVVAFPGGSGTEDMKRRARRAGVLVMEAPLP